MGWSGILVLLLWPVWNHSTTFFWRLLYIERVLLSPNTFSGLKISHMRLLIAFTSPLAGWGGRVEGVGWKGREREGEEHTKFRQGIHGWDITTSVLEEQTAAISEFPPFDFDQVAVIYVLFWIKLPNFVQIGPPTAESWRHIQFQNGVRGSSILFPVCISWCHSLNFWRSTFIDISVSTHET